MARKKIEVEIVADDKISADLDRIEADAKALDDLTVELEVKADTGPAVRSMDDLDTKTDKTGNVMANFAGNASQDLGEIAGVGGSAGVAIGQIAEAAAEGEVAIGKLVTAAGPIAGVMLAIEQVKGQLAVLDVAEAFDTAQIEAFTTSILAGKTALEALQTELTETGKVMFKEMGESGLAALPWGDDTVLKDITDKVVSLGLNVKTFSELAAGTQDLEDWMAAMEAAGQNSKDVRDVFWALVQERARLRAADEASRVTRQFLDTGVVTPTTVPGVTATTQPVVNNTIATAVTRRRPGRSSRHARWR